MAARGRLDAFAARKTPAAPAEDAPGGPPDEVRAMTLRLKPQTRRQLKLLGVERDKSMHSLITEAIDDLLRKYER